MRCAIVTGAFGFAGANLVECLLEHDYMVYAVGRENSPHNNRLHSSERLKKLFVSMEDYDKIADMIDEKDIYEKEVVFFHLSWGGARDDFDVQLKNVEGALKAMDSAIKIGTHVRFVGIGSQAEYGENRENAIITENTPLKPFSAYGAAKAAAFYLLKNKAKAHNIHFAWGRIFSLTGKYEPEGRMLPDLVKKLKNNEEVSLSSCRQYWDYLDARDAAEAIRLIGERGADGEAYNIANGNYRTLREYVEETADILGADKSILKYRSDPEPFVSLKPSVEKLKKATGWEAGISFRESIKNLL